MKISQLMNRLEQAKQQFGDVEVMTFNECYWTPIEDQINQLTLDKDGNEAEVPVNAVGLTY